MNSTVAFFSLVIHNEGEIKQTKWIEIYQYYYMYNLQTWPLEPLKITHFSLRYKSIAYTSEYISSEYVHL